MKKRLVSLITAAAIITALAAGCGSTSDSSSTASAASSEPAVSSEAEESSSSETAASDTVEESTASTAAQTGSSDSEEVVAQENYRIGFANASVSNSWRVKMHDMLMDAADEMGVTILDTDAQDDASKQISNIESLLQQDIDAILITPCVEDAVVPAIEEAYATGIPVILFDRTANTEDYTHFVGWTDSNNGAACAQMMVDALTEKYGSPEGNIVMLDSIAGSGTDNGQKEGQNSVLSQYPDIEILDRQYTDFEASKGKAAMEDFLSKYGPGEIDGFISQDGIVTLSAWQAIEEAGRDDEGLIVINADGVNGVCRLIHEGKAYGLTQFPAAASVEALKLAVQTLQGEDPEEKDVIKDPITVTAENVDDYYIPDGDDEDWTY